MIFSFFVVYISLICICSALKLVYIKDDSLSNDESSALNKYLSYINNQHILPENIESDVITYSAPYKDFSVVWDQIVTNKADIVLSYCSFIIKNPDDPGYDRFSSSNITMWCGADDSIGLCLPNIFFFSSSKSLMYRFAEMILFHKKNNKVLVLYDDDYLSINYLKYFNQTMSVYPSSPYEQYHVDTSDRPSLDIKLDEYLTNDVVCFLSQSTINLINSNILAKNVNIYYTPTIDEIRDLSSASPPTAAVYHLLPVIDSQDQYMKDFMSNELGINIINNRFYQTQSIIKVAFDLISSCRSNNLDCLIHQSINHAFKLLVEHDKDILYMKNDLHGDVKYFIGKYEVSTTTPAILELQKISEIEYNWFDPYYSYGNPNTKVSCNINMEITNRTSPFYSEIIVFYGDMTYDPEEKSEYIFTGLLAWSEIMKWERESSLVIEFSIVQYAFSLPALMKMIGLLTTYTNQNRGHTFFVMAPNKLKPSLLSDLAKSPLPLLVIHIGLEEGGISCNQYANTLSFYLNNKKISTVFIISSDSTVSQTCLSVFNYIFQHQRITVIGEYEIMNVEDDTKIHSAVTTSSNSVTVVNIAEPEYFNTIIKALGDNSDYPVYSLMINEYNLENLADRDTYPNYYFMESLFDKKVGSDTVLLLRDELKGRIERDDAIITTNLQVVYSIIQLLKRSINIAQSFLPTEYQKYMYNYPVTLDNDILYMIASNNYAQSQLHIIKLSDYTEAMNLNTLYTALPYVNGTISCDFTFKDSLIITDYVTEIGYYYIGILLDLDNEEDSRVFFSLDTIIQVINVFRINNRIILLKYLNINENDVKTYSAATKDFIENYSNILCLIGTSKYEQRVEVNKILSESDILLLVPTPVYEANCFENIIIMSPSVSQRLILMLPKLLYNYNRIVIITNKDDSNKSLLKYIKNKVSHYDVKCCVDNPIYFERDVTIEADLISQIDNIFGDGANFLISTNYKDTETILTYLHNNAKYSDRSKYLTSVINTDESLVFESTVPEVWEGVIFPVTYLNSQSNVLSSQLEYYIDTFFGVAYTKLSEQLIHLYDSIKFIQYGVETTLSTSALKIRTALYNTILNLAEGDLKFYPSNHLNHHIKIGMVKKEDSKYKIAFFSSYSSPIFPFVYSVYQESESLQCSWIDPENSGTKPSETAAIVYMTDFSTNLKESYEGLVLLEGCVNLLNEDGGILGTLVELLTDECPSDTKVLATLALYYKTLKTIVIIMNCDSSKKTAISNFLYPLSLYLFDVSFNPGDVCLPNVIQGQSSPFQIIVPSVLELVSYDYDAYYILAPNSGKYSKYVDIAESILKELKQTYYINEEVNENIANKKDLINLVYKIVEKLSKNGGLVLSFMSSTFQHVFFKDYSTYYNTFKNIADIDFVCYGYETMSELDRNLDSGYYFPFFYIKTLDIEANRIFTKLQTNLMPQVNVQYFHALIYSVIQIFSAAIEQDKTQDVREILESLYHLTVDSPIGRITIGRDNHIKRSEYLVKIAKLEKDDKIIALTQGFSGHPFYTSIARLEDIECEWSDKKSGIYIPKLYHIAISLSNRRIEIKSSIYVLRGVLSVMEYINTKKSFDFYILPYILGDPYDLKVYIKSVEVYSELINKESNNMGGIIISAFQENPRTDEAIELYNEKHLTLFFINRYIGDYCNKSVIYMTQSLYNNMFYAPFFSYFSTNIIIFYDNTMTKSIKAMEYLDLQLTNYGFNVIIYPVLNTTEFSLILDSYSLKYTSGFVMINLMSYDGYKRIYSGIEQLGLYPPKYYLYSMFSTSELIDDYVNKPFQSIISMYRPDVTTEQFAFMNDIFNSTQYHDEYQFLAFASIELWFEYVSQKGSLDLHSFVDDIYNVHFNTILGDTVIYSDNTISRSVGLYFIGNGLITEAYISPFEVRPIIFNLLNTPAYICDFKSEYANETTGMYERDIIKVGVIVSITGENSIVDVNWISGFEAALNYYNQNNEREHLFRMVLKDDESIYENTLKYLNELIEDDEIEVIFGCPRAECITTELIDIIHNHNKLFITSAIYEGEVCEKNMISTGLVPNQFLDIVMHFIITDSHPSRIFYFGDNDTYGRTIYNIINTRYSLSVNITGEYLIDSYLKSINNNYVQESIEKIGSDGGFIILAVTSQIFKEFMSSFNRFGFNSNLYHVITLRNEGTEIYKSLTTAEATNLCTISTYFKAYDSELLKRIYHYTALQTVDGCLIRAYQSFNLWSTAYLDLNKEKPTADEVRKQLYKTKISGALEDIQLDSSNHLIQGVIFSYYNEKFESILIYPLLKSIVPTPIYRGYLSEETCDWNKVGRTNEKIYYLLFAISFKGDEGYYYDTAMLVIEELFKKPIVEDSNFIYYVEDISKSTEYCANLINDYQKKDILAIFTTANSECISRIKVTTLIFDFGRNYNPLCSYSYFSMSFDPSQYDFIISQILGFQAPEIGVIGFYDEVKYITNYVKQYLIDVSFSIDIDYDYDVKQLSNTISQLKASSIIFYVGPAPVFHDLRTLLSQIAPLQQYRLVSFATGGDEAIEQNYPYYLATTYVTNLNNKENDEFRSLIQDRLTTKTINPFIEYFYTSIKMFFAAFTSSKDPSQLETLVEYIAKASFKSPEGTVSFDRNRRLKHTVKLVVYKNDGTNDFMLLGESPLLKGEVFTFTNNETNYRTCYYNGNREYIENAKVYGVGLVIMDWETEMSMIFSAQYAIYEINKDGGSLGSYFTLVAKYCKNKKEDCWKYLNEMRNDPHIVFIFGGRKHEEVSYYNQQMALNNATDCFYDFPIFSDSFCTSYSYHFSVSTHGLATAFTYLTLHIGRKCIILISNSYESIELADYIKRYINRYHGIIITTISTKYKFEAIVDSISKTEKGSVVLNCLDSKDAIEFMKAYCKRQLSPTDYPVISQLLTTYDTNQIGNECMNGHYVLTTFHEKIGEITDTTSKTLEYAKPYISTYKSFIGSKKYITDIEETVYSAVTSLLSLYASANGKDDQLIRKIMINRLLTSPSGGLIITETSYAARYIYTIQYQNNSPVIIKNIENMIYPIVYDRFSDEQLGMDCSYGNQFKAITIKYPTKKLVFYHEKISENSATESVRAMIELLTLEEAFNHHNLLKGYMAIPIFLFGDVSYFTKISGDYIKNKDLLAAIGCYTPECRDVVGGAYNKMKKMFFYTGINEGESCKPYILNMGTLPNEQLSTAITFAIKNDITSFAILSNNKTSSRTLVEETEFYINEYKKENSDILLLGKCSYDLSSIDNVEDLEALDNCLNSIIGLNPINKQLGILFYYYGDDMINYVKVSKYFTFISHSFKYFVFNYDENLFYGLDTSFLKNSYIITAYDEKIESDKNNDFISLIKSQINSNSYISETLDNSYNAIMLLSSLLSKAIPANNNQIPSEDYIRILAQQTSITTPSCILKVYNSNYVTKCIYILQIMENGNRYQSYPTSGTENIQIPSPYFNESETALHCTFGKVREYYKYSTTVINIAITMFVINEVMIIGIFIIIYFNSWTVTIKSSSPPFLYLTLVSSLILSIVILLFIISPKDATWVCPERVWCLSLAVDIIFFAYFIKAWRVHKLINNEHLKRVRITNSQLYSIIISVVFIQCIYNMFWQIFDPPKYTESISDSKSGFYIDKVVPECTQSLGFTIPLIVIEFCLFLYGLKMAWNVRHASKNYNESRSLALVLSFLILMAAIEILLNFSLGSEPDSLLALRAIGLQVCLFFIIIVSFGFILYRMINELKLSSKDSFSFRQKKRSVTDADDKKKEKEILRKQKRLECERSKMTRTFIPTESIQDGIQPASALNSPKEIQTTQIVEGRQYFMSAYRFKKPEEISVALLPYIKYSDPISCGLSEEDAAVLKPVRGGGIVGLNRVLSEE